MIRQINVRELKKRLDAGEPTYLVDVRQPWEHETAAIPATVADHVLIPLDQLADHVDEVTPPEGALVVAYCHHGVRSLNAAHILSQAGIEAVSLAGGIDMWSLQIDPNVPRY
jgi:rhodanese-related sulfurtransferase